jgi:ADP-heptose:LPS heptosyltransferase
MTLLSHLYKQSLSNRKELTLSLPIRLLIDLILLIVPKRRFSNAAGIVRLDAIGDFVVWLPAAEALVAHLRLSHQRVVLVANQIWASWAASILAVDEVVSVDTSRFAKDTIYRLSVLRRVHALGLGTCICPTFSRIPGDGNDAVVFASGARFRICNLGYRSRSPIATALRCLLNFGYTRSIPADNSSQIGIFKSEFDNNTTFLRGLGVVTTSKIGRLPVADDVDLVSLDLPDGPYIVLMPGGSFPAKAWPVERFVEVGRTIKATGLAVVVAGSSGENAVCEQLANACAGRNLAGKTSLPALAEVIRRARLVIGNDSAGIHIAVATGTDSFCVMWGGSFGRFIPYAPESLPEGLVAQPLFHRMSCFGCVGACPLQQIDGKLPCIAAVPVSTVLSSLREVLASHGPKAAHAPPLSGS